MKKRVKKENKKEMLQKSFTRRKKRKRECRKYLYKRKKRVWKK